MKHLPWWPCSPHPAAAGLVYIADLHDAEVRRSKWRIKSKLTRKLGSVSFLVNMKRQAAPTTTPPTDLQAHLGYWLRIVSNAVSQSFARKVEAEGVTVAEWVFLRVLYGGEGLSPSLLAERMGMTRGAISKLADRLVEKRLVSRETSSVGRRGQLLTLRPAARELVPRLAELADQNDVAFFGTLSGDERQRLEHLLRKIALDRELTKPPTD